MKASEIIGAIIGAMLAIWLFSGCEDLSGWPKHVARHRSRVTYWTGAEDRRNHNSIAIGGRAIEGHTVAAAPSVPFGTRLSIPALGPVLGGGPFVVEDRGNFRKWCSLHGYAEASNLVDVYVSSRAEMNWLKRIMPDYLEVSGE